jgi:acetylornithine/succinyldiaminopimelate/putrescine aminotransferase/predicted amino acid dehydrogenase/acyl-coenzyme A synthetase/AMP-(fatty) acid ligase
MNRIKKEDHVYKGFFDHIIRSQINISQPTVNSLAALLYTKLDHRPEDSKIILSHDGNKIVTISLERMRFIVYSLFEKYKNNGIKTGDTVLLASISGNNELFTALQFIALSCFGIRVLLPMFMEMNEISEWIRLSNCNTVFIPEKDILSLTHHDKEKTILKSIKKIADQENLTCFDLQDDFQIKDLLYQSLPDIAYLNQSIIKDAFSNTNLNTESLLITTSGSSGKSKIVTYEQGAFIRSCISWQIAGFYDNNILGGRGFTPLFTHTMGIRAFFNALWTGVPVCLIISEWFIEKPETVRYFLMNMKPAHFTGGPAVYNLLLEIMRNFPELKIHLKPYIKTLVSSGAPLSTQTIHALDSSFGVKIQNAFGTTETQQVLSTLISDSTEDKHQNKLGLPLPGVSVGLKKLKGKTDQYRMYIKSPFGCKTYNQDNFNTFQDFFDTGDIVKLQNNNELVYIGREVRDFFKDEFGVKIPISALQQYYDDLYIQVKHIEYFPLQNNPGLSALIFIDDPLLTHGPIVESSFSRKYVNRLSEINTKLYQDLEPFEFWHRHISRFALINKALPLTGKGTVSRYQIETDYRDIIETLINPLSAHPAVRNVENNLATTNTFTRFHNPLIGHMLSSLGIDYSYHKAKKDSLFTFINGEEIEILDLTGGYGGNLLGHNNERIKDSIYSFLKNDEVPLSDQGSIQKNVGLLAEQLSLLIGSNTKKAYNVLFASTGAEAVEVALHHALFEWRENLKKMEIEQFQHFGKHAPKLLINVWKNNKNVIDNASVYVVSLKNAFHGNSSGARSVLGNQDKRNPFLNILSIKPIYLDDDRIDWQKYLDEALNKAYIKIKKVNYDGHKYKIQDISISSTIAAIMEPIIGEGGVRVIDHKVLNYLQQRSFPLIIDEIQCGLGRSGKFLASEGIQADYYLLGKSLGGGIEKISAILIDKNRYKTDFGKYYLSTFANGGMAARVALETLSIIKKEELPEKIRQMGNYFEKKLKNIQKSFPQVIDTISGQGLMLGIKFKDFRSKDNFFLRILQERDLLGYLFSAYFLCQHNIRILPTLSAPNILRIEPSAYITKKEINRFVIALKDLVQHIQNQQLCDILLTLMDNDPFTDNKNYIPDQRKIPTQIEEPLPGSVCVAFIIHYAYPLDELRMLEPTLQKASDTGLRILLNRSQVLMDMQPVNVFAKNICNGKIHFRTILLPIDSAEMQRLHHQNKRNKIISRIQEAVNMAANNGAKIISLGGYTSIITNNGNLLSEPKNTKLITGNTLTAAAGIKKMTNAIENSSILGQEKILAVVGATGNIGSIIAETYLSQSNISKIYLIGRRQDRLKKLVRNLRLKKHISSDIKIEITTDFSPLKNCNIIVVMTNSNDPLIFQHHLSETHPVYIFDVSVPSAIAPDIKEMKNVTIIPFTSYISLPEDPEFVLSSCSPAGTVLCCAGEAILCGLETVNLSLRGNITFRGIQKIIRLAEKYNFFSNIGEAKSFKATA